MAKKRRKSRQRQPRLTMASTSFREAEIQALLDFIGKAEMAPDTRVVSRHQLIQAVKAKFLRMRDGLKQRQAARAFHVALEEATRRETVARRLLAVPVRPSARAPRLTSAQSADCTSTP